MHDRYFRPEWERSYDRHLRLVRREKAGNSRMHKHGGDIYTHKNVLDFSANMNFRGMPEQVKQAAKKAIDDCGNYPDPDCRQLREAIAVREQVSAEHVICGNGAADLIFTLVRAKRPKRALLPAPTFYEYEQALESAGCKTDRYYMQAEKGFQPEEDFIEHITPQTDLVFICNPNNPTGVLTEPALLERILERCISCGVLLVVDECFNDFLKEPERYSVKSHLEKSDQLFILKAFTKMYAMAGLRLGYGLCRNRELLSEMKKSSQPWSVSLPAQMAGIAAAQERKFAAESREQIREERDFLTARLRERGYQIIGSKANYIFFRGPEDLYEKCLKQGILIRDCSNYEGLTRGWYRIAVKNRADNLRLLEVMEDV